MIYNKSKELFFYQIMKNYSEKIINLNVRVPNCKNKYIPIKVPLERAYFNQMKDLINKKHETVISTNKLIIKIDYPLEKPIKILYKKNSEFYTRIELINIIINLYEKIYNDKTDKYGIYGHYIEDLLLKDMKYNYISKVLTLNIIN